VSNLGMYEVTEFTAVINYPESAIRAVARARKRPVADAEGNGVGRPMMKATLSCDHRLITGAVAAAFLQTLKNYLEKKTDRLVGSA